MVVKACLKLNLSRLYYWETVFGPPTNGRKLSFPPLLSLGQHTSNALSHTQPVYFLTLVCVIWGEDEEGAGTHGKGLGYAVQGKAARALDDR